MSDSSAPAPAPRRSARRGASASQPASREPSPSAAAVAAAPAVTGSASVPGKDASAHADANTSTNAVDAVVANAGGNKEQEEKSSSGAAGNLAAETMDEDAESDAVDVALQVKITKWALELANKRGDRLTYVGHKVLKLFKEKKVVTFEDLCSAFSLDDGHIESTDDKLQHLTQVAVARGSATLVRDTVPVQSIKDPLFLMMQSSTAIKGATITARLPATKPFSSCIVTGVATSSEITGGVASIRFEVRDYTLADELEKLLDKETLKHFGVSLVVRAKDGKADVLRLCARFRVCDFSSEVVMHDVPVGARHLLLEPTTKTLTMLGLNEVRQGGEGLGGNACQMHGGVAALYGTLAYPTTSLTVKESLGMAAILLRMVQDDFASIEYVDPLVTMALESLDVMERAKFLESVNGGCDKKSLIVNAVVAVLKGGKELALPASSSTDRLVKSICELMGVEGVTPPDDATNVYRLTAYHAAAVSTAGNGEQKCEDSLRSIKRVLGSLVNIVTLSLNGATMKMSADAASRQLPAGLMGWREGHWFCIDKISQESPLRLVTEVEQETERVFARQRQWLLEYEASHKAPAATLPASSSSPPTKKCTGDGCTNSAPLKDDKCGKCKGTAGPTATKAKAAPAPPASAWSKPPTLDVAAKKTATEPAAKATVAESVPEPTGNAATETNPWTAVVGSRKSASKQAPPKPPAALPAALDFVRSALQGASEDQVAAARKRVAVAAGMGASLELAVFGGLCNGFCASGAAHCIGLQRSRCCFRPRDAKLSRPREHFSDATEAATFVARHRGHFPAPVQWFADRALATGGKAIVWPEARAAMEQKRKAKDAFFPHVEAVNQVVAKLPQLQSLARSHELAGLARVRVKEMPLATASHAGQKLSTSGGAGVHVSNGTPRAASSTQGAAPRAAVTPAASSSTGADSHSNFEHGSSPLSGTSSASIDPKSVSAAASPTVSGVSSDSAAFASFSAQLQAQREMLETMQATMDSFQRFVSSFGSRASSPAVDASCAAPPASPSSAGGGAVGGSPSSTSLDVGGAEGGAEQSRQ